MSGRMLSSLAVLALLLPVSSPTATAQPLSKRTYAGYKKFLTPGADQMRWMKVDWQPSYWDGVIEAHKQRKPVLVWAMNGHPLGCT